MIGPAGQDEKPRLRGLAAAGGVVDGPPMIEREVRPELLDEMDPADPEALRSRRDLRMVNFLMGNERWIAAQVRRYPAAARGGIVELGAGDGYLARRLAESGPVTGVDLVPRPADLPGSVRWLRQDALRTDLAGGILVANLFLHHFEGEGLREIGRSAGGFEVLVFVEPWRTPASLALGRAMLPFVNRVTRHDMLASIRAGFLPGELGVALGLSPDDWSLRETCSWRGGLRVLACRT